MNEQKMLDDVRIAQSMILPAHIAYNQSMYSCLSLSPLTENCLFIVSILSLWTNPALAG